MSRRRDMLIASSILDAASLSPLVTVARVRAAPRRRTAAAERPADGRCRPTPPTRRARSRVDDKVLAIGKKVFTDKCQKCHGPKGLGDGPDADPDHAEDMNLTNPKRADRNPDGVVFYKVLNGRRSPKMPAFKDELLDGADLVGRRLRAVAAQEVVRHSAISACIELELSRSGSHSDSACDPVSS